MKRLIGPGTVITPDHQGGVIEGGGVLTEGGTIAAVGGFHALSGQHPDAAVLSAGGGTVMPGLINAHTHLYGIFARGMSLKEPPPQTFRQVLERLWWRLDQALNEHGVYLSAALGGIAALRAGCTAVIDHHSSPNAIDGSLDLVAEALSALGLRAALCYEVSDRHGPERARAGIAENVRFARRAGEAGGRLAAKFGLHAAFTLGPETMAAARRAEADLGVGFHIHCAEGPDDDIHSRKCHSRTVVRRLHDEGVLGERCILAHCVQVGEPDMDLLARSAVTVSHQPHSNMGNAVGWAQMLRMGGQGVRLALGTDGYTWDMIETMRAAAVLHSHSSKAPGTGVGEFAETLLAGNGRLGSEIFGCKLGSLEAGAAADLVILDYFPPTPVTAENLPWHLQFGMHGGQVRTVLVNGEIAMHDRVIRGLDELELAREARRAAVATWERC